MRRWRSAGDIPPLVQHFIRRYARDLGKDVAEISPEALEALERYRYPGNVRELENLIERAVTLADSSKLGLTCLPPTVLSRSSLPGVSRFPDEGLDLEQKLAAYESELLQCALQKAGGVKKKAAKLLGISFRSFRYRLEKLEAHGSDPSDSEKL